MALTDRYMLWSYLFVFTLVATALYIYRAHWLPIVGGLLPEHAYTRLSQFGPLASSSASSTFEDDLEAGLSSDAFSLSDNIESGDSRSGLDAAAKRQILQIMKRRNVNFDEARRIFIGQKFARNGIGADGRPTDPRAVFFS